MPTSDSSFSGYIPLCEPNLQGKEKQLIGEALDSNWLSGGAFLTLFEQQLSEYTGSEHVVGTSSGTTALHIALILAGVKNGDLVFVPNLTFVATANAVKYLQADPILVDINPDTWLMDLELLENYLENETEVKNEKCCNKRSGRHISAIVIVHLLGNICDIEALLAIAGKHFLKVIEDAACALGSFQRGKHAGTSGLIGALSFNSNKIITTGGGGAILTDDADLAKKAKYLITQAKNSSTEYYHQDLGYNYRLLNPLAAMGVAQMELLSEFVKMKRKIANYYSENLFQEKVGFQVISPNVVSNYWHFAVLVEHSRKLISHLANHQIESRPLWIPINELPVFTNDIYVSQHNESQKISGKGLMLPCSTSITDEQLHRVTVIMNQFLMN